MNSHIIDELRPTDPPIDPTWEAETMRSILARGRGDSALEARRSWQAHVRRPALIAATVAVIIGGLFVARQQLPADDVRPAGEPEKTVQTIDPSEATELELGETLDVVADLPQTFDGDPVLFSGFAGDDTLVGDVTRGEGVEQPVMYDLDAKTFSLIAAGRRSTEPIQVVDASGDDKTVVWAELVGTNVDASTFSIHSYDRATQKATTLGAFDDPDGQVVYGNDLAIAGDTAYFSTPTYPKKAGQEAVYAVPVDGSSPPTVVAAGGRTVTVSGDTLTFRVGDPKNREAYPRIETYDLRTGDTSPVPVSDHVDDPGFCGAEVTDDWTTWCTQSNLLTIEEKNGRTTEFGRFPVEGGNPPHDITRLGRWTGITVTSSSGQDREFLVDLDTKDVQQFPDNTSFTAVSPGRSAALISSYASKGPGPQRIVRIPDAD